MPLYEYECQQCQRHTEKRQKFSDPEITTCPHCGGHLQRVITAPAIAFKGGGWYADGYGNAKPKSSADGGSSSDGKSSGEGKPSEAASSGEGKPQNTSTDSAAKSGAAESSKTSAPTPSSAPASPAPASSPGSSSTKS